ncbi:MAG: nuclease family protein [Rickettsiaceae bacterium]|nr:nuclease family protein [Rickettsiaceae bacterium]
MRKLNHKKAFPLFLLITFLSAFIYWILTALENGGQIPQTITETENKPITTISGIAQVVDGDTIKINKERIRFVGIDAPESKQKCLDKNYYEYLCGEISTEFLKKLVNGKKVECQYQERDIYNRYLGVCKIGTVNINYEMVKNGMSIIYNLKEADGELKRLEAEAKRKKLGVWQGSFQEPKDYRKKNRHKRS